MKIPTTHIFVLATTCAMVTVSACKNPADDTATAKVEDATATAPATPKEASADGTTLKIDTTTSKISWVGSKVTGSHEGGFKNFSGTITLKDNVTASSVNVEIDTTSIYSDSDKLTGHLKSPDFFGVEKHPKATFTSVGIQAGGEGGTTHVIKGNLAMHGVTKTITFPATIKVEGNNVSANAEFDINRKDWGIVYAGKPDDLIRDEVVIKLDVKAAKNES